MLVGVAAGGLFWVFSEVVALASLFVLAGALMGTVGLGVWLDSHEPHRRGSVAIMFLGAVLGGYLVLLAELIATEILGVLVRLGGYPEGVRQGYAPGREPPG